MVGGGGGGAGGGGGWGGSRLSASHKTATKKCCCSIKFSPCRETLFFVHLRAQNVFFLPKVDDQETVVAIYF